MPSVIRVGDLSVGHDGYPPTPVLDGTTDFLVNGKAVALVGSKWQDHRKGKHHHSGVSTVGSTTFLVNGVGVVRTGDAINDGDHAGAGSPDFICG